MKRLLKKVAWLNIVMVMALIINQLPATSVFAQGSVKKINFSISGFKTKYTYGLKYKIAITEVNAKEKLQYAVIFNKPANYKILNSNYSKAVSYNTPYQVYIQANKLGTNTMIIYAKKVNSKEAPVRVEKKYIVEAVKKAAPVVKMTSVLKTSATKAPEKTNIKANLKIDKNNVAIVLEVDEHISNQWATIIIKDVKTGAIAYMNQDTIKAGKLKFDARLEKGKYSGSIKFMDLQNKEVSSDIEEFVIE